MNNLNDETSNESYEEIFRDYEIFIEPNPDKYRGGFAWSVSKDECELDCGLAPSMDSAIAESHIAIDKLTG